MNIDKMLPPDSHELASSHELSTFLQYVSRHPTQPYSDLPIDYATLDAVNRNFATPFNEIEKVSLSHTAPYYETFDNVIYPETVSVTLQGWYGNIDAHERTLSLLIAGATTDQPVRGFVLQGFHDNLGDSSYAMDQTAHDTIGLQLQTIAGNYDSFADLAATEQSIYSAAAHSYQDQKRTLTLRALDTTDLQLMQELYASSLR